MTAGDEAARAGDDADCMDGTVDVLLVDDDETWVESTGAVLEHQRASFSVTTATTLADASSAFEAEVPDCVVCDYQLEQGTGLGLLDEVRDAAPELPFLLVTGAGNESVASDAIGQQVTDYLPKRTLAGRDDVLARRIETTVRSYRTERALARERRSKEAMLDIVTATTSRDGLAREFCQHLANERGYDCVWIGTDDHRNGLVPQSIAGDGAYVDAVLSIDDGPNPEPARAALEQRSPVVETSIAGPGFGDGPTAKGGSGPGEGGDAEIDGPGSTGGAAGWRAVAADHGIGTAAAVPVAHDGSVVGVLAVYASERSAIDDADLDVLGEYGRTIGYAFRTAEWKQSLVAATSVVATFEVADDRHPLLAFDANLPAGTTPDVLTAITLEDGLRYLLGLEGADEATVLAAADGVDGVTSATVDAGRCELTVSTPTPERLLAEHGGRVLETIVDDGRAIVTVVCPDDRGVESLSAPLETHYSDVVVGSIRSNDDHTSTTTVADLLASTTDKQLQAAETAYHSGYFEHPREHNTTEVAARLGVSRATFTQHLRAAERKLFARIFDPE